MGKKAKKAHILVIRLSAMGDVAMTIPVLKQVLADYPELHLTVLTKKLFVPIFSDLDRVTVYVADVKKRHKGMMGLWRLHKELKPNGFSAVADLHNVLRSKVLCKYFGLAGINCEQLDKGRKEKKALTSAKTKVFQQLKSTHQRYAEVFAQLGYPIKLGDAAPLQRKQLSDHVLELVQQDGKKWIGIAPFAAHEGKMYPISLMEKVINTLNNTEKYKILLFGGGTKEVEQLEEISGKYDQVLNMAGKLNLSQELELISNLDLMVSMDSGNAHLATNFGIPVVTLWGVTHPFAGFYPYNQPAENALLADRNVFPLIPTSIYGNKMPEGYEAAMTTIDPSAVEAKILNVLGA